MSDSEPMWKAVVDYCGDAPAIRTFGWNPGWVALCLALLCLPVLSGCTDNSPGEPGSTDGIPVRITKSLDTLHSENYFIQSVSVLGRTLTLDVTYTGGCAEHSFRLFVSSQFMESDPVRTRAFLVHEDTTPCSEPHREDLVFDLTPLLEEYRRVFGRSEPILIQLFDRDTATTDIEVLFSP